MFFPFLLLLELYLTNQAAAPPLSVPLKRDNHHQPVASVRQSSKPLQNRLLLFHRLKRSVASSDDEDSNYGDDDEDERDDLSNWSFMTKDRLLKNKDVETESLEGERSLYSVLRSAARDYNDLGSTFSGFFMNSASKHALMNRVTRQKADKYMAQLVEKRQAELANQTIGPSGAPPRPPVTDVAFSVSTRNLSEVIILLLSFVLLLVYTTAYWLFFRWKGGDNDSRKRKLKLRDLLKGKNIVLIKEEEEKRRRVKRRRRKVGKKRKGR